ncbi:MAG: hypothetical protein IT289_03825 [Oligoflexia bacterium]|nr:hypothetical protein [Oligoflexia bacterium]
MVFIKSSAWLLMMVVLGCSNASRKPAQASENGEVPARLSGMATIEELKDRSRKLDSKTVERIHQIYTHVFTNNDKKAKLAYGRHHKHIPHRFQFALDLRFKNYDHAEQILKESFETQSERDFFETLVKARGVRVVPPLCEQLLTKDFQMPEADKNAQAWAAELELVVRSLLSTRAVKSAPSELDKTLDQLECDDENWSIEGGTCSALTGESKKKLMGEAFFDKFRNLHRRDVRFVREAYRDYVKVREYNRYVSVNNMLRFYRAIQATSDDQYLQSKYIRRFKGAGRDMRPENLVSRLIGGVIIEDAKDVARTTRLLRFVQAYPELNVSLGLEFELASCGLKIEAQSAENN